jgi:hypothetical protein
MFHFRVVEVVMRFEKPVSIPKTEKAGDSSKKRKREDLGDNSDVDMDMFPEYPGDEGSRNYVEKGFFHGAKDKLTARRPTWRYRWRGSETGEGEIHSTQMSMFSS